MTTPDRPTGPNTTAKARAAQEALKKAKQLILPDQSDPRQRWLLIRLWPTENRQGEFFLSHEKNFPKFDKDPRFKVHAVSSNRAYLSDLARKMTLQGGPAYQPPSSAVHRLPPPTGPDPEGPDLPTSLPSNQQENKK